MLDLESGPTDNQMELSLLKNQVAAYEHLIDIMVDNKHEHLLLIIKKVIKTHPHLIAEYEDIKETESEKQTRLAQEQQAARLQVFKLSLDQYRHTKIMAIKQYKEITGLGLKEAKDWVDREFIIRGWEAPRVGF